jgi:ornithine decarboxylase
LAQFILSKSKALEQFNSIKHLGIVSYSFKTNPKVGQVLEDETECMFSVHFINELKLIKDKSRVWYLAQTLNENILKDLFSMGVSKFVVENQEDLDVLLNYVAKHALKIDLLLRMKLKENTIKTEKYYVFGLEADKVNKLLPQLDLNPNILSLGVHFHRKTQNVSEWDLVREISELINPENIEFLDYVNIGGGLPVMYKNITDKAIVSALNKIKELQVWLDKLDISLIVEPGRYISGPAVKLEANVIGVHGNTIVVDASVYNSSPDTLIVPIKLLIEGEVEEVGIAPSRDAKAYVIKGITPCSTDIFRYRVYLKHEPKVGEKVTFLNAGAYNFHTQFCELDKVVTEVVE